MSSINNLNSRDFERIKKMKEDGMTYDEVTEIFKAEGRKNVSGSEIVHGNISNFMCAQGYRLKAKKSGIRSMFNYEKKVSLKKESNAQLREIEELMTSNLNPVLKVRVLKELIKDI